jgi:hypothetical protein
LKNKALIVVESPLQLLAAFEAIQYYKIDSGVLVIRLSNEQRNDTQLTFLNSYLKLNEFNVFYITINSENKKVIDFLKLLMMAISLPLIRLFYKNVILGSFRSGFISLVYKFCSVNEDFIFVDDGTSTLEIKNKLELHKCRCFTQFYNELENTIPNAAPNEFSSIKATINKTVPLHFDVLFIGSGIAEIGITNESKYLDMVERICENYTKRGLTIRYVPHRVESAEKIAKISKFSDVEIININYPVELLGIIDNMVPDHICSFYSTALVSMKSIYGCEATSYFFDYKGNIYEDEINNVYQFMSKYIQVKTA